MKGWLKIFLVYIGYLKKYILKILIKGWLKIILVHIGVGKENIFKTLLKVFLKHLKDILTTY